MYNITMFKAKKMENEQFQIICRITNSRHISLETPLSSLTLKSHRRWAYSAAIYCVP